MMEKWEKVSGLIARTFGYVGGGAVAIMTVNILIDVSMRALFTSPIAGTLEYVQYWWMILIAFGGLALAAYKGEHIDAPILSDRLSARAQVIWRIVAQLATVAFLSVLIFYGWQTALHAMSIGEYQGGYSTPIWPFRFFVPIALAAFLFVVLNKLVTDVVELIRFDADKASNATTAA